MDRLDKILAHHGYGTRKDVKRLCHQGLVFLNGKITTDPSVKVDISRDTLVIDSKEIKLQHDLYIMLNKCQDTVCANKDGLHRTVFDLLDPSLRHKFVGGELHCMGRLDIDTEGLLILTTDGELTHKILSPKTHAPKTYAAGLRDSLSDEQKKEYVQKFSEGFYVDREQKEEGFDAQPSSLVWAEECTDKKLLDAALNNSSGKADCFLTIYEGKFHQVKRMFSQLGNEVIYLKRVKMGSLYLDSSLKPGEYRELREEEKALLTQ